MSGHLRDGGEINRPLFGMENSLMYQLVNSLLPLLSYGALEIELSPRSD